MTFEDAPPGTRAADHAYMLYARALHPEALSLLRSRRLEGDGWRARVGLVDPAGHLIEVVAASGAGAAVELVAPRQADLPTLGRLDLRPLGGSTSGALHQALGVEVETSWSFERPPDLAAYRRLHERILASRPRAGERLLVRRGHPENDGPAPFTLLDVDARDDRLETFAVHAFPADGALFFVQSVFRAV